MPTETPRILLRVRYYEAAQRYLRQLPLEHFMEATPQATQRKITLESLDLVEGQRPGFQLFNELLVQYPLPRRKRPGQVVPDNMVVLHSEPIEAVGSYDVPLQPVGPYWVLEYVSRSSKRKDYDDNMRKYEHELKVPYYLLFAPDAQELTLYRHTDKKYAAVVPNEHGRCALPEVELEVGLLDGWVRYWYRGELLPLPGDLLHQLRRTQDQLEKQTRMAVEAQRQTEEAKRQMDEAKRQMDEAKRQTEQERQAREATESKLAALQAENDQLRQKRGKKESPP